jgi:hypothetical protein
MCSFSAGCRALYPRKYNSSNSSLLVSGELGNGYYGALLPVEGKEIRNLLFCKEDLPKIFNFRLEQFVVALSRLLQYYEFVCFSKAFQVTEVWHF